MHRLYEIGFQKAGRWTLQGEELVLQLEHIFNSRNALYAFVSGSSVKYVGKTTQSLQRRMFGYQKPNIDQRTNWRNRIAIIDLLRRGQPVEILAMADTGLVRYGDFHLNLAAGLEDSIIQTLKPEWNGGRSETVIATANEVGALQSAVEAGLEESVQELAQELPNPEAAAAPSQISIEMRTGVKATPPTCTAHDKTAVAGPYFVLTLQNTYHRTGFFNVPLNSDRYFGKDEQTIRIYCGKEKLAITGKINRTANTNGTPRIMGAVPLRQWFQKRKPMSQLKVSILDPTTIHINDV